MSIEGDLHGVRIALESMAADLHRIADAVCGNPTQVVGITIEPGPVRPRPHSTETSMFNVCLTKRSASARSVARAARGSAVASFQLQDNGDDTCTVLGVDAAGNALDISSVATLTPPPTSSDTTILTVDPPTGMTFNMYATGKLSTPGSPVVTLPVRCG